MIASSRGKAMWYSAPGRRCCRTPQSYCTAPGQSCWHHYWVHLDGAGVAAMEPLLLPGKALAIPQKCAEAAGGHKVNKGS